MSNTRKIIFWKLRAIVRLTQQWWMFQRKIQFENIGKKSPPLLCWRVEWWKWYQKLEFWVLNSAILDNIKFKLLFKLDKNSVDSNGAMFMILDMLACSLHIMRCLLHLMWCSLRFLLSLWKLCQSSWNLSSQLGRSWFLRIFDASGISFSMSHSGKFS